MGRRAIQESLARAVGPVERTLTDRSGPEQVFHGPEQDDRDFIGARGRQT